MVSKDASQSCPRVPAQSGGGQMEEENGEFGQEREFFVGIFVTESIVEWTKSVGSGKETTV